jgi:hypothetical protein
MGGSFRKCCCELLWVKTYQDLVADHDGWSGTAIVRPHQFKHCSLIYTDIFDRELYASLREERL